MLSSWSMFTCQTTSSGDLDATEKTAGNSKDDEVDEEVNDGQHSSRQLSSNGSSEGKVEPVLPENVGTPEISLSSGSSHADTKEQPKDDSSKIKELEGKIEAMQGELVLLIQQSNETRESLGKEKVLPQDAFSFLVVCPFCSGPFCFALLVFVFQMTTFILLTLDLLSKGNGSQNPFGIPGNVSPQLRICQFIAIVVAVFSQGDLMTGFGSFRDGYTHRLQDIFDYASPLKFWVSLLTRLSEAILGLVVSFLLITTSEAVVDLLLNFTAIEFVSNLDEVFFFLSKQGFMGRTCKKDAGVIASASYVPERKRGSAWKITLLLIILASMMVGWVSVIEAQESGSYLCRSVQVQFGDDFNPQLATFSGIYDIQRKQRRFNILSEERVTYAERRALEIGGERAMFGWCSKIQGWTFRWQTEAASNSDPCDWVARSESADIDSYDLIQTASSSWYVQDYAGREVVLDPFYLACIDCTGSAEADCGGRGHCNDGVCQCEEGWFGIRCQFSTPCPKLSVDTLTNDFASTRDWASTFNLLLDDSGAPVQAYDRPIFVHEYGSGSGDYDIIVFTGRRFGLTTTRSEDLQTIGHNLSIYFKESFHAESTELDFAFLSEPADLQTPRDSVSPEGLDFFLSRDLQPLSQVNTKLLCSICSNETNPCLYDGHCDNNGSCQCSPGGYGSLCQMPPINNGYCNQFFNTPQFNLDGGDCCEASCRSSEFQCGYDEYGLVFVGYPCRQQGRGKWLDQGQAIVGEEFAFSGSQVELSRNGAVLAITEPGVERVSLFDKDGTDWVRRHSDVELPKLRLRNIAMSTGPSIFLKTPTFAIPVLMAWSGVDQTTGNSSASVEFCRIRDCETPTFERSETGSSRAATVAMSSDGSTLAFAYRNPHRVEIERFIVLQNGAGRVYEGETIDLLEAINYTYHYDHYEEDYYMYGGNSLLINAMSLSSNGDKVVVELWEVFSIHDFYPFAPDDYHSTTVMLSWNGTSYTGDISYLYDRDFLVEPSSTIRDPPRPSFAMSGDGNYVVVTIDNCIHQVLARKNGEWVNHGQPINGTLLLPAAKCYGEGGPTYTTEVAQAVAMSEDGSTIAVGIDGQYIATFGWNSTSWEQKGDLLPGGPNMFLSLSSDGLTLATGLPLNERNDAGVTKVYSWVPEPVEGHSNLRVSVTPDTKETSWEVRSNRTGEVLLNSGDYSWGLAPTTDTTSVPVEECLVFTVYPYRLTCSFYSAWGCTPPVTFSEPARLDAFLDGEHAGSIPIATNAASWTKHCGNDLLSSGHETVGSPMTLFPPRQVFVGKNCTSCPEGTQQLQIMMYACNNNSTVTLKESSSTIGGAQALPFVHKNNLLEETAVWEWTCIDSIHSCYTLTIQTDVLERRHRRSLLAESKLSNGIYYVFLDGEHVADGGRIPFWKSPDEDQPGTYQIEIPVGNC
ncbi:expressed unknown protein [Seminavis robusta]|uniref:EGF-like domain-containing protein n=1 Tax=Seminavis robusta TaxID=568900 RepID=A0A9N8HD01_9STRA|nr:expressed unknown protein [Seminavis robusta]|eukprot:Sro240_g096070.1 n/a (1420) ;mRNA; r:11987-16349